MFIFAFLSSDITAQTKTPTPSPTPKITTEQKEIDTIEKIKDLVASKVAELKLVDKRGILGIVVRTSFSQVVIEDHKGDHRSVDIDELTKFVSSKDSFGISDIKEGDRVSIIGLYNKDTKRLLARFVALASNVPMSVEGVVTAKNARTFSLTLIDTSGKSKTIDVETSTKTNIWDDTFAKSGFSKVSVGERILVIGFEDLKDKTIINASRVIHFVDLLLSGGLKKYQNTDAEETPTPSATPRSR